MIILSIAVWNYGHYDRYIFFSFDKKNISTFYFVLAFIIVLGRHVSFQGANIKPIVSKTLGLTNVETSQS